MWKDVAGCWMHGAANPKAGNSHQTKAAEVASNSRPPKSTKEEGGTLVEVVHACAGMHGLNHIHCPDTFAHHMMATH